MAVLALGAPESTAGTVTGKLEIASLPARAPLQQKGFLERTENPVAPVRPVNVASHMVVVLEGAEAKTDATAQVQWDLVGESLARPVLAVPAGSEVVIRNQSKTARTLVAVEDPNLLPAGTLNPTGNKSFRVPAPTVLTITEKATPHLRGTLVVVATPHVAAVSEANKFELANVPEGTYKLRVFYKDAWVHEESVTVPAKSKSTEVVVKLAQLAPAKK